MYQLILYVHVASAIAFFLVHGATASAMFGLKREQNPQRVRAILAVREVGERGMGVPILTLLISGIMLSFMGSWWEERWVWLSLGLFVVVGVLMSVIGRMGNMRVAHALDPDAYEAPQKKEDRKSVAASPEEVATLQARLRPVLLTGIGVVGLAAILWLMMFKPF